MKVSNSRQWLRNIGAGALACRAATCHAEFFYGAQTNGVAGSADDLTIHPRACTLLEALDIVPALADVASVLHLVSFDQTPGLTEGGTGLCTDQACAFFYLPEKTFAADTLLAHYRFTIDPAAPLGVVAFDTGVVVGDTALPLPSALQFEVVAVPEPSSWLLFLLGAMAMPVALRRMRG